ncbi:MAG: DUF1801 domain-containing protein [Acidobacteria bacterium]|nr:DUF1801 domain-containing protein [Acidobacteriota bacterium]
MTVLDYIEETTPAEVRRLLTAAHQFLQAALPPFARCAIKWRIPFYTLRRNFCYLNRHPDHITLGFPDGFRLAPRPGVLLGANENLKRVRYLEIRALEDLYSDTTRAVLHEAIILDELKFTVRDKTCLNNER